MTANQITIIKDEVAKDFKFPVIEAGWQQPLDCKKLTRRIITRGEVIVEDDSREGKTSQEYSDSDDSSEGKTSQTVLKSNKKK